MLVFMIAMNIVLLGAIILTGMFLYRVVSPLWWDLNTTARGALSVITAVAAIAMAATYGMMWWLTLAAF